MPIIFWSTYTIRNVCICCNIWNSFFFRKYKLWRLHNIALCGCVFSSRYNHARQAVNRLDSDSGCSVVIWLPEDGLCCGDSISRSVGSQDFRGFDKLSDGFAGSILLSNWRVLVEHLADRSRGFYGSELLSFTSMSSLLSPAKWLDFSNSYSPTTQSRFSSLLFTSDLKCFDWWNKKAKKVRYIFGKDTAMAICCDVRHCKKSLK